MPLHTDWDGADEFRGCALPRYCDVPFPAYRFVPGREPHPTSDPEGHSYVADGEEHPPVNLLPPELWRESVDYLFGCDLYNHAYWWEAHEAWEGLWQLTDKDGPQGRFLSGLIKAAACHLNLFMEDMPGATRLWQAAAMDLRAAVDGLDSPTFMGLNAATFRDELVYYYMPLTGDKREAHVFSEYPYLRLVSVP